MLADTEHASFWCWACHAWFEESHSALQELYGNAVAGCLISAFSRLFTHYLQVRLPCYSLIAMVCVCLEAEMSTTLFAPSQCHMLVPK